MRKVKSKTYPNIVYIFADQLRYSALGSSGNKIVQTPNLDRLAEQGVSFNQAFSSCPICSPYRAQLITGRYSHKNGVPDNDCKLRPNQVTIHQALKNVGYQTAHIGKWHLGKGPYTQAERYGLDYMFAYNCDHMYYGVTYHENERGPIKTHGWSPGIETSKAIEFIEKHCQKNDGSPFSIHLGFAPPHNNLSYYSNDAVHVRGYYDLYPGEFNIYNPAQIKLRPNVPTPLADFARNEIADYYGNISGLDAQIGRLMTKLEELGISENTIVCFSSDHGDHLRSHGYGVSGDYWLHHTKQACKGTPYEEAIHIPFIMRYPKMVKSGSHTQILFNSVDVMPTLLGMCGIDIPDDVQGKDLSHAARGIEGIEPDSVYLQLAQADTGSPGCVGGLVGHWRGLRTNSWLYARWDKPEQYEHRGDKRKHFEHGIWLFDRRNDPYEMNNLTGENDYSKIENELETRLKQWMRETDDSFDAGK